jgi:hypothetical protein
LRACRRNLARNRRCGELILGAFILGVPVVAIQQPMAAKVLVDVLPRCVDAA